MPYDVLRRSPDQDAVLDRIQHRALHAGGSGLFAFDLDGCLFDNRPRQLRIARAWAEARGETRLSGLRSEHYEDWSFSTTLQNLGLPEQDAQELAEAYRPFWERWFFDDAFVAHDLPLPGAPAFVRSIAESGVRVAYVTGRLVAQSPGTLTALRTYGFPISDDGRELVAKPSPEEGDGPWKRRAFRELTQDGPLEAFLDNEPAHLHHTLAAYPGALSVWLRTDHSPGAVPPPPGTPQLYGFLRTQDRLHPGA